MKKQFPLVVRMQGRCIPGCVEDACGQVFYRQVLTNGVVINLVDAALAVTKRRLGMHVPFEAHAVLPPSTSHLGLAVHSDGTLRVLRCPHPS